MRTFIVKPKFVQSTLSFQHFPKLLIRGIALGCYLYTDFCFVDQYQARTYCENQNRLNYEYLKFALYQFIHIIVEIENENGNGNEINAVEVLRFGQ